jgi:hypothetical protein
MMMRTVFQLLIVTVSLVAISCADVPSESSTHQAVRSANRLSANRLSANRLSANRLSANRLSANRLSANRLAVNLEAAGILLSTEDGRELFSFIVSCALPNGISLDATIGGTTFEFFGEIGLVPDWLFHSLDAEGRGWISACLFAHVTVVDVATTISLRGPHRGLAVSDDERSRFPVEEGAFYGNLFTPLDRPIDWIACRGEGQESGEFGGLINRDCTEPDPAHPGLTKCGFNFAGDCGTFSAEPTCEQFSDQGQFYRRCHAGPIDDERHHGHAHHRHGGFPPDRDDRVFQQVITTYVTP